MAAVQVTPHFGQLVIALFRQLAPGQGKNIVQIIADDRDLRRIGRSRLQLADLLAHHLGRRRAHLLLCQLLQIILDRLILRLGSVVQLFADHLEFFMQKDLPLGSFDLVLDFLVEVSLHVENGILLHQYSQHLVESFLAVTHLQQQLLLLEGDHHVGGGGVGQFVGVGDSGDYLADLIGHGGIGFHVADELAHDHPRQRADPLAWFANSSGHQGKVHLEVWRSRGEFVDLDPLLSLDQRLDGAIRQAVELHHGGHRADADNIVAGWILHLGLLLGGEDDRRFVLESAFQRLDRLLAPHEDGRDHAGKDYKFSGWKKW